MTTSIYHFFKFLADNSEQLTQVSNLENLDFDDSFVSSQSKGVFPDLAIKINTDNGIFTGGELIEFKGSKTLNIASFNSTIPTGKKAICDIVDESRSVREQMEQAGNNINSMPYRDVYYLLSGRKKNNTMKIVLVHGSFFETISIKELIRSAFAEILKEADPTLNKDSVLKISSLFSNQKMFSQVRRIDKASVKIRFRIMTEAETNANLLNSNIYPQIKDNTINLCIPYKNDGEKSDILKKFNAVFTSKFKYFTLTHKINNGNFILFQRELPSHKR